MPLAAITHEQLQHCPGGASAVTACIVEELLDQNLSNAFVVAPDVPAMSLTISGFVSDMEGQRAAYGSKGSAALRPCLRCGNCLMKGAHSAEISEHFCPIEEADLARFVPNNPREIEESIVHWMGRWVKETPCHDESGTGTETKMSRIPAGTKQPVGLSQSTPSVQHRHRDQRCHVLFLVRWDLQLRTCLGLACCRNTHRNTVGIVVQCHAASRLEASQSK